MGGGGGGDRGGGGGDLMDGWWSSQEKLVWRFKKGDGRKKLLNVWRNAGETDESSEERFHTHTHAHKEWVLSRQAATQIVELMP